MKTVIVSMMLLTSFVILTACKKEKNKPKPLVAEPCPTTYLDVYTNDTVLPSPYLMTYPGSEWNYDNGDIITCTNWGQNYTTQGVFMNGCTTITKTHKVFPYSPYLGWINYDSKLIALNDSTRSSIPYLDTTIGQFYKKTVNFLDQNHPAANETKSSVVEILDSMIVLGITYYDIIHVQTSLATYNFYYGTGTTYQYYEKYYAKNVGLIRTESKHVNQVPIYTNLTNYTIGPH